MNIADTSSGPGKVVHVGASDGPYGNYSSGTKISFWWKRGDGVDVKICETAGCNATKFFIEDSDVGINLGEDMRFKEQVV